MALRITCPSCTASFTPADDLRGKKAFCPKCGAPLVVTSGGVAKGNETRRPVPARTPPARSFNPLWLLLPLLLLLLLLPGGLAVYLFTRGHTDEPKQVAKNDDQPPAPAPNHQNPSDDPSAHPNKARDPGAETKVPPNKQPDQREPALVAPINTDSPEAQMFRVRQTSSLPVKEFSVGSLTFSPDGKTLAGGGVFFEDRDKNTAAKGQIRLWDLADPKKTRTLSGTYALSLAFSPDSKTLASIDWPVTGEAKTGEASLWDATTGERINTFNAPKPLSSVAFSRDGKTVAASCQADKTIQLWDVNTGKNTTLPALPLLVAFSPDGTTLASAGWEGDGKNGEFKLWNVAEGKNTATLPTKYLVNCFAFSSDGKTLVTGEGEWMSNAATVEVWEVASGKKIRTFAVTERPWVFSLDGKMLATQDNTAHTIKLWDVASGKVVAELGHTDPVSALAFSRDGTKVATSTYAAPKNTEYTIHLWELTRGTSSTPKEK